MLMHMYIHRHVYVVDRLPTQMDHFKAGQTVTYLNCLARSLLH